MRSCLLAILIFLAAVFGVDPAGSWAAGKPVTSLADGRTGEFVFQTRDVKGFQDLITGPKAYNAGSLGTLYLPPEAGPENKVAVMVILHGSGGEWSGRGRAHAQVLNQHGIGALVVDTFSGRGLTKKDRYIRRLMKVNLPDQLTDAFAALDLLQTHPHVDGGRIGVMGYSLGGTSAVLASFEEIARHAARGNQRFALHVGFYPPANVRPENGLGTGAPVVCLWGGKDLATPKADCRRLVEFLKKGGAPVRAVWYPEAAHGWNSVEPLKFYKGIPNFAPCRWTIRADGSVLESRSNLVSTTDKEFIANTERYVDYGYSLGRHPETDALTTRLLVEEINAVMPAP